MSGRYLFVQHMVISPHARIFCLACVADERTIEWVAIKKQNSAGYLLTSYYTTRVVD